MIRAALYLAAAISLLSVALPNPFPGLIVGGMVAFGAWSAEEHGQGRDQ